MSPVQPSTWSPFHSSNPAPPVPLCLLSAVTLCHMSPAPLFLSFSVLEGVGLVVEQVLLDRGAVHRLHAQARAREHTHTHIKRIRRARACSSRPQSLDTPVPSFTSELPPHLPTYRYPLTPIPTANWILMLTASDLDQRTCITTEMGK